MPEGSTVILAAFPFYRRQENAPDGEGEIAPFAVRNYYREMIVRLKEAAREAGSPVSDLTKREMRFFSNSRLPEKALAVRSGLGFIGRNSLLISEESGSFCLLAGWILPFGLTPSPPQPPARELRNCGQCRLCEEACPSGALKNGIFNRERCLQNWTTDERPVPDNLKEVWGMRIYGCTVCQDICPWNRKIQQGILIDRGPLPSRLSLEFLLTSEEEALKAYFRGTALGMSWISPALMKRNGILAAAGGGRKDLISLIEQYRSHPHPSVRDGAEWTLNRLRTVREP